ncbi:alpha/beta hydrolase fold domain-containing protein [Demequina soli]|uniref:alpha/beta hydrolase fold domain-containing protein n=1 Tax=Demequina soli TaxID=1638987 RepID=UPI000A8A3CAA|nr:alpha/beta hydrolase fold domain-containing protein [Demequina soli]
MSASSIPVPVHMSAEARAYLQMLSMVPVNVLPEPDDVEAWNAVVAGMAAPELALTMGLVTSGVVYDDSPVEAAVVELSNARIHVATPAGQASEDPRTMLFIHGGGFTNGGGESARLVAPSIANSYGVRVWNLDYRMPPAYPAPAALDDALEAYARLVEEVGPTNVVVGGLSAGANIATALMLRLQDEGLPMPAGLLINSLPGDAAADGDSHHINAFAATYVPGDLAKVYRMYARGSDATHPYVSPLNGDIGAAWPRTILLSGTRDFLLSDTVRMHRKLLAAGTHAELHVFEGAPHGFFGGRTPEDAEQVAQVRAFLAAVWER